MRERRGPFGARLWFGLAILALGVLWTLDNLNLLESEPVLAWWPLVLVGYGVWRLSGIGCPARPVSGAVWLALGLVLLGHSLGIVPWGIGELWPVLLILFGGSLVWRSLAGSRDGLFGRVRTVLVAGEPRAEAGGPTDADQFSCVAGWAGVDRKSTSQALRGGDYTAVMGGGDIDLRGARPIPEGAVIELFVLMGGLDVRVPEDWRVMNELTALMGAVEDSRAVSVTPGPHTLVLKGAVIMGGVEIKN